MNLSHSDESDIVAMAWDDQVPFEAIAWQYGLREADVIALMKRRLKSGSFRVWRKRVQGRLAKHAVLMYSRHERF